MYAFTDYPIKKLGDIPYKLAPIRECEILEFDGDKYCKCRVFDNDSNAEEICWIKIGYIYEKYGRFGDVPIFNRSRLNELF